MMFACRESGERRDPAGDDRPCGQVQQAAARDQVRAGRVLHVRGRVFQPQLSVDQLADLAAHCRLRQARLPATPAAHARLARSALLSSLFNVRRRGGSIAEWLAR